MLHHHHHQILHIAENPTTSIPLPGHLSVSKILVNVEKPRRHFLDKAQQVLLGLLVPKFWFHIYTDIIQMKTKNKYCLEGGEERSFSALVCSTQTWLVLYK